MKKFNIILSILFFLFTLAACGGEAEIEPVEQNQEQEQEEHGHVVEVI